MSTQFHILNLGAGVQSTALYLLIMRGRVKVSLDAAIFADTGDEPSTVYAHLDWLKSLGGPRIIVCSRGRISDDLLRGANSTGQRFASIPAYTKGKNGLREGQLRRQCTREYKVDPIHQTIRRDILGLKPRRRTPKDIVVHQYYGISLDEAGRAGRIRETHEKSNWKCHFPLVDMGASRADCLRYLADLPHEVPRSACVFCPYRRDAEWLRMKEKDPDSFAMAVKVDAMLREPGRIVNRGLDQPLFIHRSCQPLSVVMFKPKEDRQLSFALECEGMCGI